MDALLYQVVFYVFAALTVLSALAVVSAKNSVHSVLFLILCFFTTAALFILLGAEYIAMTLVIVYVGAVAVLFLFVVMMLNVNFAALREGFAKYLPVGAGLAILLFGELFIAMRASKWKQAAVEPIAVDPALAQAAVPAAPQVSNIQAIGNVLYTNQQRSLPPIHLLKSNRYL
ncbi:MAG: NADH-quinone oxidoreductase subunit J, partial [Alphaproteobacteria bacterium]|nr:NADH-quinone oxidoreductase subunit J [Alphaproteobacteria bacterium]